MQAESLLLRRLPPDIADARNPHDEWARSPLSALPDASLAAAVAAAIAVPKRNADSSFLTHAPLELAARFQLLPMVAPAGRDAVRRRIAAIAGDYARAGEEVETAPAIFGAEAAALESLKGAIREGDFEGADAALLFLIPRLSPSRLGAALAADIMPMLGAAAHAPILLADLPRLEGSIDGLGCLLRTPVAMIAKAPQSRLSWHESADAEAFTGVAEVELFERLRAPPVIASPSVYIAPTMLAVEAGGYAADRLGDVTAAISVEDAARAVLRVAAYSMLQDDPSSAPYGWTHALTMPLGLFRCASMVDDQRALVRIAATYALGFRATLGKAEIENTPPPKPRRAAVQDAAPIDAAGAVYHAEADRLPEIRAALATRAAAHPDAHLAKYTLAAFAAAARDPEASRLHLAAAAWLGAWWDAHPGERFE